MRINRTIISGHFNESIPLNEVDPDKLNNVILGHILLPSEPYAILNVDVYLPLAFRDVNGVLRQCGVIHHKPTFLEIIPEDGSHTVQGSDFQLQYNHPKHFVRPFYSGAVFTDSYFSIERIGLESDLLIRLDQLPINESLKTAGVTIARDFGPAPVEITFGFK